MQPKKSSRKLSIIAAILILALGIFIGGYLVLKSNRIFASQLDDILRGQTIDPQTCQPDANDQNKDSDDDGLKDWQELQLYSTDPCKQDTDGDGYLDGEEVASGYDPAKKAPGDELPGTKPKTPRPLPQNLTQALSQMLTKQIGTGQIESFSLQGQLLSAGDLAKYPALQQSVREIMNNSAQLFAPDPIDDSQIKTTPDNSKAAIQAYAVAASKCTECVLTLNPDISEPELFLQSMQNNDFSEMDRILGLYQKSYAELLALTVPTDLVTIHKEQLNIFSSLIKTYLAIKEIENDPLKANLAIQNYAAISSRFNLWLQSLSQIIETHP